MSHFTITKAAPSDFQDIHAIINDGAQAYKNTIPTDRYHEPYMPEKELQDQISGVEFWKYTEDDHI
ncbi:MAG: hypothetical protein ABUM51_09570 [Bacteroidota bacterium]